VRTPRRLREGGYAKTRTYVKARKAKSYVKTMKAMKNTNTRKTMSYVKNTKAMKHIENKTTHQKKITKSVFITIVATMSPLPLPPSPLSSLHKHNPQTYPQKENQKNLFRNNAKTRKTMAEYTTYLICFYLLKLSQGT
jgi:hypothetical protein